MGLKSRRVASTFSVHFGSECDAASSFMSINAQRDVSTVPYPTAVQTSLFSYALFAKFSPSGRYVADGRNDGSAAVWDLETRAPVRTLEGHTKGVTSIEYVPSFSNDFISLGGY